MTTLADQFHDLDPSGRVPLVAAIRLAVVLLLFGNIAAVCASFTSGLIALILTGCILGYDGGLKNTLLGPLVIRGVLSGEGASGGHVFILGYGSCVTARWSG